MKTFLPVLIIFVSCLSIATGATPRLDLVHRDENDKTYLAAYETNGQCFHYFTEKQNLDKSKAPCKVYCKSHGGTDGNYGVSNILS